ncbi:UDP-glucose 4-epimerase GalE [Pseudomonas saponiphila]|uniref:UDP-glucose 4-epimerase n=1 Tax=Pseudomonas saponiphila TaxID=556534 RepID=A0A1H4L4V2_9PSED|nr:UDP-glucose 4-epimerase GalE [Pseudomonas saponiphila]SEB65202.1 UDP-galactose 4-epimerase [Pseudomonas saponiphila]
MKKVLITGGVGYIGSHTLVECLQQGYEAVVLDNLVNSSSVALDRVEEITGKRSTFFDGDIRNSALLDEIFKAHKIDCVIHFAGLKAVGESVAEPLSYYDCNVNGSLQLCQAMSRAKVFNLVFSSSATVYGDTYQMPLKEEFPAKSPINPYGRSKYIVEQILQDLVFADPRWSVAVLRYFNPVGAHPSGLIGEDPKGVPNNLFPYVSQVAVGARDKVSIFGNDYDTADGTGVRDYIHVMDLARGHIAALEFLQKNDGIHTWNLGTGKSYSVLAIVDAFRRITGANIPSEFLPRRPGDLAECWSDPSKACKDLGWSATLGLDAMVADSWRWQSKNPSGYR